MLPHRLPALDALRGIAAVGVLMTHCLQAILPDGMLNHTPLRMLVNGRSFVIFFFVLSGFVLATALFKAPSGTRYKDYVLKRFARLYPPYLAAGLLALSVSMLIAPVGAGDIGAYLLTLGTTEGIRLNLPSWSLVYELRLSLVMPLVCAAILWNMRAVALATVAVFIGQEIVGYLLGIGQFPYGVDDLPAAVVVTLRYGVCFAVGALVAHDYLNRRRLFRIVALWPICAALSAFLLMSVILDQASLIGAVLVIALALEWPLLRDILAARLLLWLGACSYSLYLTHTLVVETTLHLFGETSAIIAGLLAIPAAIAFAVGFHRLVEEPSIRLSRHVGQAWPPFPRWRLHDGKIATARD